MPSWAWIEYQLDRAQKWSNRGQYRPLIRHFFRGFFDNELVSPHGESHVTIAKILALLATPGLLTFWLLPGYQLLRMYPPETVEPATYADKLFFITISMVVMGFATVLQWDSLFPDRRDYTILVP